METLLSFLGAPIFGSIVGSVSSFFTKREERKVLQLKFSHDETMAELTAKNRREELELQGDLTQQELDGKAFVTSQKEGNKNSGVGLVDGIKTLVRPVITVYLLTVVSYLAYSLNALVGGLDVLTPAEIVTLYKEVLLSILTLCGLCISWWFGQRPSSTLSHFSLAKKGSHDVPSK